MKKKTRSRLDRLEAAETADWVADKRKRERKESPQIKAACELERRFAIRHKRGGGK